MRDPTRDMVLEVLTAAGFRVSIIREHAVEKRADLLVEGRKHRYALEVKGRTDERLLELLRASDNGVAHMDLKLEHRNKVAAVVREAAKQTQSTDVGVDAFRVAVIVCLGPFPEDQADELRVTLYGVTRLLDIDEHSFQRDCYYFGRAALASLPSVDGVLVLLPTPGQRRGSRAKLFLNPFSARAQDFANSEFGQYMSERNGLENPLELERSGKILCAPLDVPPGDAGAKLLAIQNACGRRKLTIMHQYSFQGLLEI